MVNLISEVFLFRDKEKMKKRHALLEKNFTIASISQNHLSSQSYLKKENLELFTRIGQMKPSVA